MLPVQPLSDALDIHAADPLFDSLHELNSANTCIVILLCVLQTMHVQVM